MARMNVTELKRVAADARRVADKATADALEAQRQLDEQERQVQLERQQDEMRLEAVDVVANTTLPIWCVRFIQMEADERGHSAGEYEVDVLTVSGIRGAEGYLRTFLREQEKST